MLFDSKKNVKTQKPWGKLWEARGLSLWHGSPLAACCYCSCTGFPAGRSLKCFLLWEVILVPCTEYLQLLLLLLDKIWAKRKPVSRLPRQGWKEKGGLRDTLGYTGAQKSLQDSFFAHQKIAKGCLPAELQAWVKPRAGTLLCSLRQAQKTDKSGQ